jgi:hypothetical protein
MSLASETHPPKIPYNLVLQRPRISYIGFPIHQVFQFDFRRDHNDSFFLWTRMVIMDPFKELYIPTVLKVDI